MARRMSLVLILVLSLSTNAFAGLFSGGLLGSVNKLLNGDDIQVDVDCPSAVQQSVEANETLSGLTHALYEVQESGVHGTLTALTGKTIKHSYVWVNACGANVPLDPMWVD